MKLCILSCLPQEIWGIVCGFLDTKEERMVLTRVSKTMHDNPDIRRRL